MPLGITVGYCYFVFMTLIWKFHVNLCKIVGLLSWYLYIAKGLHKTLKRQIKELPLLSNDLYFCPSSEIYTVFFFTAVKQHN